MYRCSVVYRGNQSDHGLARRVLVTHISPATVSQVLISDGARNHMKNKTIDIKNSNCNVYTNNSAIITSTSARIVLLISAYSCANSFRSPQRLMSSSHRIFETCNLFRFVLRYCPTYLSAPRRILDSATLFQSSRPLLESEP